MMKRYYTDGVMNRHAPELFMRNRHRWEDLSDKEILIAGAGGLGSFVLAGLLGTGIGKITVVDKDVVEPSNLNRQFWYGPEDLGRKKVDVLRERVVWRPERIDFVDGDVKGIDLGRFDVVMDCLDRWEEKRQLLVSSLKEGVPYILLSAGEGKVVVGVPSKEIDIRPRESRRVSTPEIMVAAGYGIEAAIEILGGGQAWLHDKILVIDMARGEHIILEI